MTMTRAELSEAARGAFADVGLAPDAAASWPLIAEMGFLMAGVPETQGGLGLRRDAVAAIHVELGRALVPGPAIAQLAAIGALAAGGQGDLLDAAMAGTIVTTALLPDTDAGTASGVPDADRASHLLTIAPDRVAVVPLTPQCCTPRQTWDRTRRLFDVEVPTDGAIVLAEGDAAAAPAGRLNAGILIALAADSIGGADAVLTRTIDYLKTRRQFDRPLAMFQALKHRVADLKTHLAAAEALLWSVAGADNAPGLDTAAALKAHACAMYLEVAEEAIQLHGGIGLTMEHPCHLFLKRAMLNAVLGEDGDRLDEQVGRSVLERSAAG